MHENMKTAAGMLCLAGILSLGMGTTVFGGGWRQPLSRNDHNLQLRAWSQRNDFEKARRKYLPMQTLT